MSRWLAGALALPLGIGSCALVVHDVEEDDASGAGAATSTTTTTSRAASGAGGSPIAASTATAGGEGPGAGGGSGGGGGDPEPLVACPALAWLGEPLVHDLHDEAGVLGSLLVEPVRHDGQPHETGDTIALLATYAERDEDVLTRNLRSVDAVHPWIEASGELDPGGAFLAYRYAAEWTSATEVPTPLAAGRGGFGAYPVEASSGAWLNERLDDGGAALPEGARDVREVAWSERGFYAVAYGDPAAPRIELVAPFHGAVATPTSVAPCADRPVALDIEPYGDGFLVASATSAAPGGCDPTSAPTVLSVTRIDDVGVTMAETMLDVGVTVAAASVHTTSSAAWIAIRTEGAATVILARADGDGTPAVVGEIPLAVDRGLVLSTRGDELILLDSGAPTAMDPALRVRTFGADLSPIAATPAIPGAPLAPHALPALHVRADGGGILAVTFHRITDEHHALVALRAVCVDAGAP